MTPHTNAYRSILQAGAGHIMSFHVIVAGGGVAAVPGCDPVEYSAGNVIPFPQSDGYKMGTAADTPPEFDPGETMNFFRAWRIGTLGIPDTALRATSLRQARSGPALSGQFDRSSGCIGRGTVRYAILP